jgi:hypothetical protein
MTKEDLGAIYDYLKTLPPVKKKINRFPDAPPEAAPADQRAATESKS